MIDPSTSWRETPSSDEARRHAAAAAQLVALQRLHSAADGNGRALHRKQLIALQGSLRVYENLPLPLRHGLFAAPGSHEVWVRLSNGGPRVHGDLRPDIRGFALRVFGVDAPSALGGHIDHQDFTLINHSTFAFPDSRPFVGLVQASQRGKSALLQWALRTYGPLRMLGQIRRLAAVGAKRFTGFATEPFYSAAPIACGPYAVRVRLLPPRGEKPAAHVTSWADDLNARLGHGPLVWRLQLQFFVDEDETPIEDASVDWPESTAPYQTVADLLVEAPGDDALAARIEAATFDPWQALAAHRPLGEVMRSRKVAYFESQKARGAA